MLKVENITMSGADSQRAILDSLAYWDTFMGSSFPECGAIPRQEPRHEARDVSKDVQRVVAYSAIAGAQIIDRRPDESPQDFQARVDARMSSPEAPSEVSE